MKVQACNIFSIIRENSRIVAGTDHDVQTVTGALDEAEEFARDWNTKEDRPDMLVTVLTCNGFIRTVPVQKSLAF